MWYSKHQAIKAIKKWKAENDNNWIPDWNNVEQKKYYNYYNFDEKKIYWNRTGYSKHKEDYYCFSSEEMVEKAGIELAQHYKILRDIKE